MSIKRVDVGKKRILIMFINDFSISYYRNLSGGQCLSNSALLAAAYVVLVLAANAVEEPH